MALVPLSFVAVVVLLTALLPRVRAAHMPWRELFFLGACIHMMVANLVLSECGAHGSLPTERAHMCRHCVHSVLACKFESMLSASYTRFLLPAQLRSLSIQLPWLLPHAALWSRVSVLAMHGGSPLWMAAMLCSANNSLIQVGHLLLHSPVGLATACR